MTPPDDAGAPDAADAAAIDDGTRAPVEAGAGAPEEAPDEASDAAVDTAPGGVEDAISIPEFGAFAAIDDDARRALAAAGDEEVARFGPTSEGAHPTVLHDALDRLRSFCLLLPETTEVTPFGHPTFRVAAKAYATFELVDDRASILFKAEPEVQAALVEGEAYEPDPIAGHHGWTLVWLDDAVDWDAVDELIIASYRLVAPPEHVAQLDALLG